MQIRRLLTPWLKPGLIAVALLALSLAAEGIGQAATSANVNLASLEAQPENRLELRQYRLGGIVPGHNARQNMTAFQVLRGTWNGQTLDGLSVVLVEQVSSGPAGGVQRCCYVSESATLAQRDALLAAVAASQPALFKDIGTMRIEPAVITLEHDGPSVVLHLGLIA